MRRAEAVVAGRTQARVVGLHIVGHETEVGVARVVRLHVHTSARVGRLVLEQLEDDPAGQAEERASMPRRVADDLTDVRDVQVLRMSSGTPRSAS